jgi:hypothetical protein
MSKISQVNQSYLLTASQKKKTRQQLEFSQKTIPKLDAMKNKEASLIN